jgi:DegV family protein with EDD domain
VKIRKLNQERGIEMQIVTDVAMDLLPEQTRDFHLHVIPLKITLSGKTYRSGEDITADEFYALLSATEDFPTTSQPSAGEFAELYRKIAKDDPDILSIHVSSGLSGTLNAAKAGAEMVPEAKVIFIDTKTLSSPMGWQVEAAAKALKKGWGVEAIKSLLAEINARSEGMFTLPTLKYLIHGGRISHLKGLIASMLNIKPIIGVEKVNGTYVTIGQEFTLKKSIQKMVDYVSKLYGEGAHLRVQPLHANNLPGVEILKEELARRFKIIWEPITAIAPVLGAHTGPGLVGLAVGPASVFGPLA